MYSPQLGRFLSRDPLVAGQPDIFYDNNEFGDALTRMRNLYGYCDNNPINRVDPSGLDAYPAGPTALGACGNLEVRCNFGEKYTVPVFPDSSLASTILLGGSGCVTLPLGIFCTGSCKDIKTWKSSDNPNKSILEHEACHYCALQDYGYCAYLKTAGGAPDGCVGKELPAKPIW